MVTDCGSKRVRTIGLRSNKDNKSRTETLPAALLLSDCSFEHDVTRPAAARPSTSFTTYYLVQITIVTLWRPSKHVKTPFHGA